MTPASPQPEPTPALELPASADTDEKRMICLRRMAELHRLGKNRAAPAAKRAGKLRSLELDSRRRYLPIAREIIRVRQIVYPNRLKDEDGDPQEWADKLAWCEDTRFDGDLDGHPSLVVPELGVALFDDPTQDFTTWTDVDPNTRHTTTAGKVSGTIPENEDSYVYNDFGLDHFEGDYEHRFECAMTAGGTGIDGVNVGMWTMATDIDDFANSADAAGVHANHHSVSGRRWHLKHRESGVNQDNDNTAWTVVQDTVYYVTMTRTGSTVVAVIDTVDYGDTNYDTLQIDDDGTARRYGYAFQSFNLGTAHTNACTVQNLDLQEGIAVLRRRIEGN